jgi:cytochrome c556
MIRARFVALALALAVAGAAFAQSDPIAARQAAMKEVGRNFGAVNRMNRGQDAYDGAAASAAFTAIATAAAGYAGLFPEGSETGGDTEALPAIWENKAEFDALATKLEADAQAAAADAGKDEAAFKAAFANLARNCSGCHKKYRQ